MPLRECSWRKIIAATWKGDTRFEVVTPPPWWSNRFLLGFQVMFNALGSSDDDLLLAESGRNISWGGIQCTLAMGSRIPGKYQIRICPQQSTKVFGCSNGPNFGVGNPDMNLLSAGAGERGVPGGIWWATVALANDSASQEMVSRIGWVYGYLNSQLHVNLLKLKNVWVMVKVMFHTGRDARESTSCPRPSCIFFSSLL